MSVEFYRQASVYEGFIRRAHKSLHSSRNGASLSYMENLMNAEVGSPNVSHLGSAASQFTKVQGYIDKALDKFLARKLTEEEEANLKILKHRLTNARNSKDLMAIVREGIDVTQRFKDYDPR